MHYSISLLQRFTEGGGLLVYEMVVVTKVVPVPHTSLPPSAQLLICRAPVTRSSLVREMHLLPVQKKIHFLKKQKLE